MTALEIRKLRAEDFAPLHKLLSDPAVMRYLEPPFSETQTKEFLQNAGLSEPPLVYAATLQGQFIGYVIDHPYDETTTELGWVLLPEYWGNGYATKLAEMMVEKAKNEQKDAVIECAPQQTATRRIAEKLGFAYCGREDGLDVFKLNYK